MRQRRYRYILAHDVLLTDPVSDFMLDSAVSMKPCRYLWTAMRITIPDDMELEKLRFNSYSTTEDERTIQELNPMPMVMFNGKWKQQPALLSIPKSKWNGELRRKQLKPAESLGYLNPVQWDNYIDREIAEEEALHALMVQKLAAVQEAVSEQIQRLEQERGHEDYLQVLCSMNVETDIKLIVSGNRLAFLRVFRNYQEYLPFFAGIDEYPDKRVRIVVKDSTGEE